MDNSINVSNLIGAFREALRELPRRCKTQKHRKSKPFFWAPPTYSYLVLWASQKTRELPQHSPTKNRNPSILCQLRTPLLQHCLFLLSCEGVDLGVQRGSERVLCCLADRLRKQLEEDSIDRTLGLKQPALCFGAVFWVVFPP